MTTFAEIIGGMSPSSIGGGGEDMMTVDSSEGACWVASWFDSQTGGSYDGNSILFSLQLEGTANGAPPFLVPESVRDKVDTSFNVNVTGSISPVTVHLSVRIIGIAIHFLDIFVHGN